MSVPILSPPADSALATDAPVETDTTPFAERPTVARDAAGRTLPGYPGPALRHGLRSQYVRSGQATGDVVLLAERRQSLHRELANLGVVKTELADAFIELSAVRAYLGGRLATEGPLTGKGRTRALLTAYLSVVDRQTRLAALLGVDRPPTPIATASDLLTGRREGQP